ncbi:XTP/dITP diphosphatase [Aerococcus sanguinicola]|uniref:dITP/XTP pyrophosphatase n=1 Tax=Aerococcus sanguinicola TaxID=119206 RepID=A0A120I9E3_9LACT|nr:MULTISPECIES: XTP/dITP diphosphatase [Aerococcus]AMB94658.1 non-canonical purine NTP pyrophosphatase [Aerococcus sanguinicola]MDK7050868.1 XTP/dITP diphosphatase [Aerococcus sanguinicola]OFT96556.1 non-canonical purine NTP pyrophosphatase [Aerococcus sp. HMSC23C02]PKZ23344.1 XTP/dITP diphosphatase [Aerococcus sanguinicola]
MKKIVIATKNPGKAKEFEMIFADYQVETLLDHPEMADIEENGRSFLENAGIKARTAAQALGEIVIADDSGLSVDALDGAPGIYSARYAGPEKSDAANRIKLLEELQDVDPSKRQAAFHCVLVVAGANGEILADYEGKLEGEILTEERGTNGFGYDSLFYVPSKGMTTAEMTAEEKAAISHRGQALAALQEDLDQGKLKL